MTLSFLVALPLLSFTTCVPSTETAAASKPCTGSPLEGKEITVLQRPRAAGSAAEQALSSPFCDFSLVCQCFLVLAGSSMGGREEEFEPSALGTKEQ